MVTPDDKKTIRKITAKIKRILKNDISKIDDDDVKFLLYQAFITVDSFLSSAVDEVSFKEEEAVADPKPEEKEKVVNA